MKKNGFRIDRHPFYRKDRFLLSYWRDDKMIGGHYRVGWKSFSGEKRYNDIRLGIFTREI